MNKSNTPKKVAVITGASSGIGFAAAKLFLRKGYTVYGLSRSGVNDTEGITHIPCDLCDDERVGEAMRRIIAAEGGIDCLVNNAGMGIAGPAEGAALDEARYIFEVNFFGAVKTIKAAAAIMRENGGGKIINVSSVAGVFPIPFQSFYSATKAALSIFSESADIEMRPFNVRVVAVLPGDVRTNFTAARRKTADIPEHYAKTGNKSIASMEKGETNGMPPEKVAGVIYRTASRKNPRPLTVVGGSYKIFVFLNRLLPRRLIDWIIGKKY